MPSCAVILGVLSLVGTGHVGRPYYLLLGQINYGVLGLADLIAIVQLVHLRGDRIEELVLGIGYAAIETVAFGRGIEHKMVDHFVRGCIEYFDATMIVRGDIDLLAIQRKTHARRESRAEPDAIDDLALRFIEHNDGVGIRSHKECGALGGGRKNSK